MSLPRFVKCSHWYEKWIFILNAPLSRRLEVPEGVSTEDRGHNISPSSSPSSSSAPPPLSSPSECQCNVIPLFSYWNVFHKIHGTPCSMYLILYFSTPMSHKKICVLYFVTVLYLSQSCIVSSHSGRFNIVLSLSGRWAGSIRRCWKRSTTAKLFFVILRAWKYSFFISGSCKY